MYRSGSRKRPFRIRLSLEKVPNAHSTPELRSFFRLFTARQVPVDGRPLASEESIAENSAVA